MKNKHAWALLNNRLKQIPNSKYKQEIADYLGNSGQTNSNNAGAIVNSIQNKTDDFQDSKLVKELKHISPRYMLFQVDYQIKEVEGFLKKVLNLSDFRKYGKKSAEKITVFSDITTDILVLENSVVVFIYPKDFKKKGVSIPGYIERLEDFFGKPSETGTWMMPSVHYHETYKDRAIEYEWSPDRIYTKRVTPLSNYLGEYLEDAYKSADHNSNPIRSHLSILNSHKALEWGLRDFLQVDKTEPGFNDLIDCLERQNLIMANEKKELKKLNRLRNKIYHFNHNSKNLTEVQIELDQNEVKKQSKKVFPKVEPREVRSACELSFILLNGLNIITEDYKPIWWSEEKIENSRFSNSIDQAFREFQFKGITSEFEEIFYPIEIDGDARLIGTNKDIRWGEAGSSMELEEELVKRYSNKLSKKFQDYTKFKEEKQEDDYVRDFLTYSSLISKALEPLFCLHAISKDEKILYYKNIHEEERYGLYRLNDNYKLHEISGGEANKRYQVLDSIGNYLETIEGQNTRKIEKLLKFTNQIVKNLKTGGLGPEEKRQTIKGLHSQYFPCSENDNIEHIHQQTLRIFEELYALYSEGS